jgi:hypothetical protein
VDLIRSIPRGSCRVDLEVRWHMRKILKTLVFLFTLLVLASVSIVSQMLDIWLLGHDSSMMDFNAGWIALFICAATLKELDRIYKEI